MREIRPPGSTGAPIVHIHGGGWATCDLDTHLAVVAGLARASGRSVLAPHARRAPESPYPAPLADTIAALRFVSNTHPDGFFLSGDSAGANLALAALLSLRDTSDAMPVRSAALFYGCYRRRFDTPSHIRYGDGRYGLSTEKMATFWNLYAPNATDARYADLEGHDMTDLPPLQIHAAQTDILSADSQWLADKVRGHGGAATLLVWDGMAHGFLHYPSGLSSAREAAARAAEFFEVTQ
jgi:acetyl esterase